MALFEKARPLVYVKDEVEIKTTEGKKCYIEAIEILEQMEALPPLELN